MSPKDHMRSKFQNGNFENLMSRVKFALLLKICFILTFDDNFDCALDGISKKEKHILLAVSRKDSESAIKFSNFPL